MNWESSQQRERNYYESGRYTQWNIPTSKEYWLKFIELKTLPGKTLEVGCGSHGLWRYDEHVIGLDPIDFSSYGHNFVLGRCEDLPFENDEFDLIICINALDHMEDPIKALREMFRVAHNGVIIWSNVWPEYIIPFVISTDHLHPHHFSKESLLSLISARFTITKVKTIKFSQTHLRYAKGFRAIKLFIAEVLNINGLLIYADKNS